MPVNDALHRFQDILNRVASSGTRERVQMDSLPDVKAWGRVDSRGCSVLVDRDGLWVVPKDT